MSLCCGSRNGRMIWLEPRFSHCEAKVTAPAGLFRGFSCIINSRNADSENLRGLFDMLGNSFLFHHMIDFGINNYCLNFEICNHMKECWSILRKPILVDWSDWNSYRP